MLVLASSLVTFIWSSQFKANQKANLTVIKFLSCWSLVKNSSILFNVHTTASNHRLLPIHGIRVLTLAWILYSHTYLFGGFYHVLWLYRRLTSVIELPSHLWFQPIFNAWMLVDTFFFLSGLLLVYTMIPVLERRNGKVNFLLYLVHRLTRLMPAIVGTLCFHFLWPLMLPGPALLDNTVHQYIVGACEENWWSNLLFVSNWIDPSRMVCSVDWMKRSFGW